MDFARLVEVFDRCGVTFVSVTQSFNTTTSMGRLTLNVLLSFAQFEREVIGERIRDKVAASRRRGMWMGGFVPMGYRVENRKLVVHEPEAAVIRRIFERFLKVGSATLLARQLRAEDVRSHRGRVVDKGTLYRILRNRVYLGLAVHKGVAYPGEHAAIVSQALWDKVQSILQESPRVRGCRARAATPALLKGLLFGPTGRAMSPTHTHKHGELYRYYVCQAALKGEAGPSPIRQVSAAAIEAAVIDQLRVLLRSPEVVMGTASVIDGDTIEIHGQRIRLHGIDAPESRQECTRSDGTTWRCGQQAALALSDRIGRSIVRCDPRDRDRYGRIIAICFKDAEDLNRWMVASGWAVAYRKYSLDYVADEELAHAGKVGIWSGTFAMPWDWRPHR